METSMGLMMVLTMKRIEQMKTVMKTEMIGLLMELMMGMRLEKRKELEQSLLVC